MELTTRRSVHFDECEEVYLKSEADRYIAELEEKHKMEVEQLLLEITQVKRAAKTLRKKMNHNKYKRCLAEAKAYENELGQYPSMYGEISKEEIKLADRQRKWLALADKFKEE